MTPERRAVSEAEFKARLRDGVLLRDLELRDAALAATSARQVKLRNCRFVAVSFAGAEWESLRATNCTFIGCRFDDARLVESLFTTCVFFDPDESRTCSFARARLRLPPSRIACSIAAFSRRPTSKTSPYGPRVPSARASTKHRSPAPPR
jgi:hypothetical protein